MTIKKEDLPRVSFEELAASQSPQQIPAEDSETLVNYWITLAAIFIENATKVKPNRDDILFDLADSDWIFICQNPDDDEDETDFVDLGSIARLLDDIVDSTIKDIKDIKEEPDIVQTAQGYAPNYDKFDALGMTTEEALAWCNMD